MEEKYSINIYDKAFEDLKEIRDYWEYKLFTSPDKFMFKIYNKINMLKSFPYSHPICPIPPLDEQGYRFLTIDNYYVFYIVEDDEVQIHRIIYAGRDIAELF